MRAVISFLPLLSILGLASCLERPQSELSHDADKPVIDAYAKQWHAAPDSQYIDLVNAGMPFAGIIPNKILPSDDPLVARVQYWMDALDAILRKEHAEDMKGIPKPVAKIMKSSQPNAFVMNNKMCLKFSMEFTGATDESVVDTIMFNRDRQVIDSGGKCTDIALSLDEQREYLEWWIKPFTGCSLTFDKDVVTASAGCNKYLAASISSAQTVVVAQTSHFISFNTEIFRHLTETEMVSVITHELAHYYRSHGTADGKLFNFFYQVDKHTTGTRPVADASLADLGGRVLELSKKHLPSADFGDADVSETVERARIVSAMKEAIDKNLGQYTTEQEADEMALEWMAKLGLALDPGIEAQIKLAEIYFNESSTIGWVTGKDCRKAFANKWQDDKGQPMMVPVAAWDDNHHSPCFRAFNMDREIAAHKYARAGKDAQGPGPSWESLVKNATSQP